MGKRGAPVGNKNASGKGHSVKYGTATAATKAFGPRPSGGFLGLSKARNEYDLRVDNYLGNSKNKRISNGKVSYKIATTSSIKKGNW